MAMTGADFVDEVSPRHAGPRRRLHRGPGRRLGAALASMVANLTQGKARTREAGSRSGAAAETAQRVKDALVLAVDDDTNAFNAYMDARRLPRGRPRRRPRARPPCRTGLKIAVDVPWATAEACLEAMEAAEAGHAARQPGLHHRRHGGRHHGLRRRARRHLERAHQPQGHHRRGLRGRDAARPAPTCWGRRDALLARATTRRRCAPRGDAATNRHTQGERRADSTRPSDAGTHCKPSTPVCGSLLPESSRAAIAASQQVVQRAADGDAPVYGVNTGFGKLANQRISKSQLATLQLQPDPLAQRGRGRAAGAARSCG